MKNENYEIERKFIIEYPDIIFLKSIPNVKIIDMVQTYLIPENIGDVSRIRKCTVNEKVSYIKTVKRDVSKIKRIEIENEISKEQYEQELKNKDNSLNQIIKTRYVIENKGKLFEIDIYPFWTDKAVMEVELNYEDENYYPPKFIKIIKEVTGDKKFTNYGLAKNNDI